MGRVVPGPAFVPSRASLRTAKIARVLQRWPDRAGLPGFLFSGINKPVAPWDDDDWVGTPPEGRYTRDRAKPEHWRRPWPFAFAGLTLLVIILVIILIVR